MRLLILRASSVYHWTNILSCPWTVDEMDVALEAVADCLCKVVSVGISVYRFAESCVEGLEWGMSVEYGAL